MQRYWRSPQVTLHGFLHAYIIILDSLHVYTTPPIVTTAIASYPEVGQICIHVYGHALIRSYMGEPRDSRDTCMDSPYVAHTCVHAWAKKSGPYRLYIREIYVYGTEHS